MLPNFTQDWLISHLFSANPVNITVTFCLKLQKDKVNVLEKS